MRTSNGSELDPRLLARAAQHAGRPQSPSEPSSQLALPGRPLAPTISPVAMPGMPGPGGYMRYREMTIDEMLLENRVVFLVGEINHVSAANVYMKMLYLQSIKKDQDINLYINSPGGNVVDTLAVYDVMRFLSCDVATYCIGECASGGAVLFMAGKKGKRLPGRRASGSSCPTPR
jgi:ATP-dependent Clp protease, protease subunit